MAWKNYALSWQNAAMSFQKKFQIVVSAVPSLVFVVFCIVSILKPTITTNKTSICLLEFWILNSSFWACPPHNKNNVSAIAIQAVSHQSYVAGNLSDSVSALLSLLKHFPNRIYGHELIAQYTASVGDYETAIMHMGVLGDKRYYRTLLPERDVKNAKIWRDVLIAAYNRRIDDSLTPERLAEGMWFSFNYATAVKYSIEAHTIEQSKWYLGEMNKDITTSLETWDPNLGSALTQEVLQDSRLPPREKFLVLTIDLLETSHQPEMKNFWLMRLLSEFPNSIWADRLR